MATVLVLGSGLLVAGGVAGLHLVDAVTTASSPVRATGLDNRPVGALQTGVSARPAPATSAPRGVIPPVVTSAEAEAVLRGYWTLHEHVLVARDLPALARLSTGSAREWEQDVVACDCLRIDHERPLVAAALFVPRQQSFPAYFMVEAQTEYKSLPSVELLVFTKQRAGASWLVAFDSPFAPPPGVPASLDSPMIGPGGLGVPVAQAATAGQRRRARSAASGLAALWRQAKETGQVPVDGEFRSSEATRRRLQSLAAHRQDEVQASGLYGHYTFFASAQDPIFEVSLADGGEIACQVTREAIVIRPPAGRVAYQDQARHNFSKVAPGGYAEITQEGLWPTCFLIPADPGSPLTVVDGGLMGVVKATAR